MRAPLSLCVCVSLSLFPVPTERYCSWQNSLDSRSWRPTVCRFFQPRRPLLPRSSYKHTPRVFVRSIRRSWAPQSGFCLNFSYLRWRGGGELIQWRMGRIAARIRAHMEGRTRQDQWGSRLLCHSRFIGASCWGGHGPRCARIGVPIFFQVQPAGPGRSSSAPSG